MASVSGRFLGLTLGHLFRIVAQLGQFHPPASKKGFLGLVYHIWDNLVFEGP